MEPEGPSSDAIMEYVGRSEVGKENDPQIAKILVESLKSDLPEELRGKLFGFANSRVFLSKIGTETNDKRVIWEMLNLAELDYIMSLEKTEFTPELESNLQQLKFEVMLGLNLSDDGLGFKGFSESFKFTDIGGGRNIERGKTPPLWSPKRWIK